MCHCHPGPELAGRGCHSWTIGSAETPAEAEIASSGLWKRVAGRDGEAEGSERAAERRMFYALRIALQDAEWDRTRKA